MKRKLFTLTLALAIAAVVGLAAVALMPENASAYARYNDGCQSCHGAFTGSKSPKGNTFANNHNLHRRDMLASGTCGICHQAGDGDDPFLNSSDGTANNAGLGCTGCHNGAGLREHHRVTGASSCAGCHPSPETAPAENVVPPYYNTADAPAMIDPCNASQTLNSDESFTTNDLVGLDNDGDNFYDLNDSECLAAPPPPPPPPPVDPATYDFGTGVLDSPRTTVGASGYDVQLTKRAASGFVLELTGSRKISSTVDPTCTFTTSTGVLECPEVVINGKAGTYHIILDQLTGYSFELRSAK